MNTARRMSAASAEDRFGQRVAYRLSDASDDLPHEISERLKAARMMALSKRNVTKTETASAVVSLGQTAVLHLGGEKFNWWGRMAAIIPLVALVVGFVAIELVQDEFWADEIASVDAELLTDELPPEAYTDPGFAQYLRSSGRD
jgi:Protein of unknown function (DUF3619)